ncbi:MAG TPA: hypothetical protein VHA11_07630 [Bryobacteraceae bacterium]|nr:hypothetical protein [Bryobacteraceae bacterium]
MRAGDNRVHCVRFDGGTVVDRNGWKTAVRELREGDTIEVVTEPGPNPRLRYARGVRVVARPAPAPRRRAGKEPRTDTFDELFPRGNQTLAGVVKQLYPGRMVLGTRSGGETEILLRDDTRYFGEGRETGFAGLSVNARVFVRAGRNLEDNLEAYQVMWGGILAPGRGQPGDPGAAGPRGPAPETHDAGGPQRSQLLY